MRESFHNMLNKFALQNAGMINGVDRVLLLCEYVNVNDRCALLSTEWIFTNK